MPERRREPERPVLPDRVAFLTTQELAQRWRTTPAGILNLRHRGDGPRGHRIGRGVLWALDDVLAFEESRADQPQDAA